jgi:hypothetical protein
MFGKPIKRSTLRKAASWVVRLRQAANTISYKIAKRDFFKNTNRDIYGAPAEDYIGGHSWP